MDYGLWIVYGFERNGYGMRNLKDIDYRMDMDLVLNPSVPTVYTLMC